MATTAIPKTNASYNASNLILYNQGNTFHLSLPYILGLLGFIRLILVADPNAIPDFTVPCTFSNAADRTLNGYIFTANHWNDTDEPPYSNPVCYTHQKQTMT